MNSIERIREDMFGKLEMLINRAMALRVQHEFLQIGTLRGSDWQWFTLFKMRG